jgi:hypothetical protein
MSRRTGRLPWRRKEQHGPLRQIGKSGRHVAQDRRQRHHQHLLHVRLPLRHQGPHKRRPRPLHRGQSQPSGQSRRALRQGQRRHHDAIFAGPADQAADPRRRAGRRRVPRGGMGGSDPAGGDLARRHPPDQSAQARLLHRARPEPGADRLVGATVRHPQLRGAWRPVLGQHGGGGDVHHRRLVLGVRRAGLGPDPLSADVRRRRGPQQQPDQDRPRPAEEPAGRPARQVRLGQSDQDRLFGDRRRVAGHPAGHRRPAGLRADPRIAARRPDRCAFPGPLHQRPLAGGRGPGHGAGRTDRQGRARQSAVLGQDAQSRGQRAAARRHAGAHRKLQPARRQARDAGIPADGRPLSRPCLCRGCSGRHDRDRRRHHPADRGGAGARRLRPGNRSRRAVDGLGRPPAREDHRPAGQHVCDARRRRPFERLSYLPRHPSAADPARQHRLPGRLPLQAALPAGGAAAPAPGRAGLRGVARRIRGKRRSPPTASFRT